VKQEDIASFYRQVGAAGANPAGLVVKLYDAMLEDFGRAKDAIAAKNVQERVTRLNHVLLIIAELDSVLDFERGGVVARQLRGFYSVMRGLIVEANIQAREENIERLTALFTPLRKAWQQVEKEVAENKIKLPDDHSPGPRTQTLTAQVEQEPGGSQWSV